MTHANNAARRTVKTSLNFGYAKHNVALWKEDTGPVKKRNESTLMLLQQQEEQCSLKDERTKILAKRRHWNQRILRGFCKDKNF